MTNNQLCDIMGAVGCIIGAVSFGFLFFGVTSAIWFLIGGVLIAGIGQVSYD